MMSTVRQPFSAWNVEEYDFPRHAALDKKLSFLLNYAILAPSLHNTQPWKFTVRGNEIRVLADRTHQLRVADPDARELYISVGCALENILTAATYFGLSANVLYFPDPKDQVWVATVTFKDEGVQASLDDQERFHAIPLRHTNRRAYAKQAVSARDVNQLQARVQNQNIILTVTDDVDAKRRIDTLLISADITQFADPDYRDELNNWISQGEFGYRWLIARIGQLAATYMDSHHQSIKPNADVILNAPMLAVISTKSNDRLAQVQAGQVFERIALSATMLNIGIQPLSQILQVSSLKQEVKNVFNNSADFPQMAFRLGYTDVAQDATSRKQIDSVVTS